jgi:uncharacterized protein (DUF2141 family)
VDSLRSSRNFVTNFTGRTISLTFDEWVILSDVNTQVLVSPPLTTKPLPELTLKGKTVTVTFPEGETLRPNTTYTLHFGAAIKDLHEGNPAANLRYVFSTGNYIDSLRVSGRLRDALTSKGVEKITMALYENAEDSVLRKQKPFYIAITQADGTFLFENVRASSYKMAAFEDLSKNLKWEEGSERVAFVDSLIQVRDSLTRVPAFSLFTNRPIARRPDADVRSYGLVRLRYNALPDTPAIRIVAPASLQWLQERSKDTLLIWYHTAQPTAWEIYTGKDTVRVKATEPPAKGSPVRFAEDLPPASAGKFNRLRPQPSVPATSAVRAAPKVIPQLPAKPGFLDFATPIVSLDTSKWIFVKDSVPNRAFQVLRDSVFPRQLRFLHTWKGEGNALLTLLPGAVTDLYGQSNADTLQRIFSVAPLKQLGSLNLTVAQLRPGMNYILHILESERVVEERRFTADQASMRFVFAQLRPITYTVQIIEDRNGNGRWDTGDYYRHQQPEPLYTHQLEPLRSNWEVETTVDASYDAKKRK